MRRILGSTEVKHGASSFATSVIAPSAATRLRFKDKIEQVMLRYFSTAAKEFDTVADDVSVMFKRKCQVLVSVSHHQRRKDFFHTGRNQTQKNVPHQFY